jgi:hypothetical protein
MAFSIKEFNSVINKRGLAKSNLFVATVFPPSSVGRGEIDTRDMSFHCMNASLPSLEVSTTPVKVLGYGPGEKRPTDFEYNPVTLTFMVDGSFSILKFFHKWMQQIVNYDSSGGVLSKVGNKQVYEFGYKDDYAGSLEVKVFSQNSEKYKYSYFFREAFPTSVGEITPAWENGAEIMTLQVTFSYAVFTVDGADVGNRSAQIKQYYQDYQQNSSNAQTVNAQLEAQRAAEEAEVIAELEDQARAEGDSSFESGSIAGFTRTAVVDTDEYKAIYEAELAKYDNQRLPDGTLPRKLVRRAYTTADFKYKQGLLDGSIEPPEGSGIEVNPDS